MSFDPYHKWLGIAQGQRPPYHYALLGIALFESDDEVISHAADRQMMHLRSLAHGPNGHLTQRLLNEISLAKCCLLDPVEKVEYDAWLGQQRTLLEPIPTEQSRVPPPIGGTPPEPLPFVPPRVAAVDVTAAPNITAAFRSRPRSSLVGRWLPWLLPTVAIAGLAIFVWYARSEFARERATPPTHLQTATEHPVDPTSGDPARRFPPPQDERFPYGFVPAKQLLHGDAPGDASDEGDTSDEARESSDANRSHETDGQT